MNTLRKLAVVTSAVAIGVGASTTIHPESPTTRSAHIAKYRPHRKNQSKAAQGPLPHGIEYMAEKMENMSLGWGDDYGTPVDGTITAYTVLSNGIQVETAMFPTSDQMERKRLDPRDVGQITLSLFEPGVNLRTNPDQTIANYWFSRGPVHETIEGEIDPKSPIYSYADGVGYSPTPLVGESFSAFENGFVDTYAIGPSPQFDEFAHRHGNSTSANETAVAIENQALAIATQASNNHVLSPIAEIQLP